MAAIPDTTVAQLFAGDGEHSNRPPDGITGLALAFLGLPLLIFLATWLKPMYAMAGIGLMLLAAVSVAGRFRAAWPVHHLAVFVIVALAWAGMGGGSHFVYANPDWHVRDAVLGDLAFSAWPPSYGFRDGHHDLLRSVIGFFLPVAAAAKLLGPQALPWLMFAWTGIGTLLFLLLLPLPRKGLRGLLAGIAIIVAFSGMDVLGTFLLHGHYPIFPLRIEWWSEFDFRFLFSYSSLTGQLIWAPNHVLPIWIATALFYRHWKHPDFLPLLCLLLPTLPMLTPFALPGLAPFLVLALADRARSGMAALAMPIPAVLAGIVIGGLTIRLQMLDIGNIPIQTSAATVAPSTGGGDGLAFAKNYLAFILMEFAILGSALLTVLRHSRGLLIIAMGVLALLPLVKLGPSNDLLLRVATPSLVLMAILCQRAVLDAWAEARPRAMVIVVMLLIGAHTPFNELWRAATWQAWRPDYTRPFVDTQNGGLPPHYIGRLKDPLLTELLRTPSPVPNRQQRVDSLAGQGRND
ncbi:MAG: hypothetical protein HZA63_06965 [Rhodocyclales bacterium]|nr:hypothetical protein [Rhodocyclales bacterium]